MSRIVRFFMNKRLLQTTMVALLSMYAVDIFSMSAVRAIKRFGCATSLKIGSTVRTALSIPKRTFQKIVTFVKQNPKKTDAVVFIGIYAYLSRGPLRRMAVKTRDSLLLSNRQAAMKLALLLGADINQRYDYHLDTALHLAVRNNDRGVVQFLLNRGANIEARNYDQRTPLHIAVQQGHYEVAADLIAGGADIALVDNNNDQPFDIAVRHEDFHMMEQLIRAGANINRPLDRNNRTLLHQAAQNGRMELVRWLVEHGAHVARLATNGVGGDAGATAREFAQRRGLSHIADYLAEQEAAFWANLRPEMGPEGAPVPQAPAAAAQPQAPAAAAAAAKEAPEELLEGQFECPVCLDDKEGDECCRMSCCGKVYCKECLNTQLDQCIRDNKKMVCPNCEKVFEFRDIKKMTDDPTKIAALDGILFKNCCHAQGTLKNCPTPGCQFQYFYESDKPCDTFCLQCKSKFCGLCHREPHGTTVSCEEAATRGKQKDAAIKANEEYVLKHFKRCPRCKHGLEKVDGCDWVQCAACQLGFCTVCYGPHHIYGCTRQPFTGERTLWWKKNPEWGDMFNMRQGALAQERLVQEEDGNNGIPLFGHLPL